MTNAQAEQKARYEQLLVVLASSASSPSASGWSCSSVPRRVGQLYDAEQRSRREAESRADAARALARQRRRDPHRSEGVRFWNPAAEELTGIDEDGAIGRQLARLLPGWRRLAPGSRRRSPGWAAPRCCQSTSGTSAGSR